jgi:hypothetical protein
MDGEQPVEVALPIRAAVLPRYRRCLPLIYIHVIFSILSAASPLATRRCHALAQSILALVSLLTFPYFYVIYSTLFLFRLSVNCLNMRSATFVLLEFLLHASNNHRSSFRDLHMSDAHDRIISYVDYFIKIVYHARLELTSIWLLCDYFISEYIVNHIFWF